MKLTAYSVSKGGGMMGGRSSVEVTYTLDGRTLVRTADQAYHSQPTVQEQYTADGLLEQLSLICEGYQVADWTDLPDETIFMHDAGSFTYTFTFEGGTQIVVSSRKKSPPGFGDLIYELRERIAQARANAGDVQTAEEPDAPMTMGMMFRQPMTMAQYQAAAPGTPTGAWAKFCAACGTAFTGNEKFCPECGSKREKR